MTGECARCGAIFDLPPSQYRGLCDSCTLLGVAMGLIGDGVEWIQHQQPEKFPTGWYLSLGVQVIFLGKSRDDAIRKIIEIAKGNK